MDVQQLNPRFTEAYQTALVNPELANIIALWQLVESALPALSDTQQLQIAGTIMAQLAELYASKADRLLGDWQDEHNDEGPMLEEDLLAGLIQRTMYLDLTSLVKPRQTAVRHPPVRSVAGVVDKRKVLEMVSAIEDREAEQQALSVAHDEDITAWSAAISEWIGQQEQPISFLQLVQSLKMPLVKVWLALLLGDFALESRGEFYAADQIWVSK